MQNFARTYIAVDFVFEIREAARFARHGESVVLATHHDGSAAEFVASGNDAVFGEDEHRARTFHLVVDILDAFNESFAFGNEQRNEFGGINVAGAEFGKVVIFVEQIFLELLNIVDFCNGYDGKFTQVRIENYGLRVVVADDTDARIARKFVQFVVEFCAKIVVSKIVNRTIEATCFAVVSCHTTSFGSEMRIVVCAVK